MTPAISKAIWRIRLPSPLKFYPPVNRFPDLIGKADRIVRSGTPMCWVVWGEARRAWMYTLADMEEARGVIAAPLTGAGHVEISLDELWSQLA